MNKYAGSIFLCLILLALLSSCSNGSKLPDESYTEREATYTQLPTLTYTVEPTDTVTPQPTPTHTLTQTPTISPTPSPTPIAGVGGIVSFCSDTKQINGEIPEGEKLVDGYYFFDLTSMEYRLLEQYTLTNWDQNPAKWKRMMLLKLKMKGVSDDFLTGIRFPEDFFRNSGVLQVSSDGSEILFYQGRRMGDEMRNGVYLWEYDIFLVTSQNLSWIKLDISNKAFVNHHFVKYDLSKNNQLLLPLRDLISESVDLYLIEMTTGQVRNLTGDIEDPTWFGGKWSPDGSKIAIYTESGIWIINEKSEPILTIPGGKYPDWNPDSQTILYEKAGGYFISDWNGDNEERLTLLDTGTEVFRVQWVPDGKRLVFWSYYKNNPAWFVANFSDETISLILPDVPRDRQFDDTKNTFTWSPDQQWFFGFSYGQRSDGSESRSFVCNIDKLECFRLDNHPTEDGMKCSRFGSGAFWPAKNP